MSSSDLPEKLNEMLLPEKEFAKKTKASFLAAFDLLEDRRTEERRAADRRSEERRTAGRRASERRDANEHSTNDPVIVSIDEFQKIDLRIGKIISVERVEGSEKLLKLVVNLGEDRQILSGIAKTHAHEDLIGKEVVVIANLAPRKMMGLESRGMILAAHDENGDPVLLMPAKSAPPGSAVS